MPIGIACWRCEQPGHGYAECQRPPPQTRRERDQRNARHVERWQAGLITLSQKRQFISAENAGLKQSEKARNAA